MCARRADVNQGISFVVRIYTWGLQALWLLPGGSGGSGQVGHELRVAGVAQGLVRQVIQDPFASVEVVGEGQPSTAVLGEGVDVMLGSPADEHGVCDLAIQ